MWDTHLRSSTHSLKHAGDMLTVANARRYQVQHRRGLSPNVTKEILMARSIIEKSWQWDTRVYCIHAASPLIKDPCQQREDPLNVITSFSFPAVICSPFLFRLSLFVCPLMCVLMGFFREGLFSVLLNCFFAEVTNTTHPALTRLDSC